MIRGLVLERDARALCQDAVKEELDKTLRPQGAIFEGIMESFSMSIELKGQAEQESARKSIKTQGMVTSTMRGSGRSSPLASSWCPCSAATTMLRRTLRSCASSPLSRPSPLSLPAATGHRQEWRQGRSACRRPQTGPVLLVCCI